jgi:DNA-binding Lrp family transcriptional regulator
VATRRHPEVIGAYTVSGEADALVHLRAADIAHLERALERIRAEPFITSTRSMIVLSRLVDSPGTVITGTELAADANPESPAP